MPLEYTEYYNLARPHQGIKQRCPIPVEASPSHGEGSAKGGKVSGGSIHRYYREAT